MPKQSINLHRQSPNVPNTAKLRLDSSRMEQRIRDLIQSAKTLKGVLICD